MTTITIPTRILLIALIALLLVGQSDARLEGVVHDAEYYILEAQNGERWAAEDKRLGRQAGRAASEARHASKHRLHPLG